MKRYCLFVTIITMGCGQSRTNVVFPEGGYPYPAIINACDSTYFYLPVKNQIPRQDSFFYEDSYLFYRSFDEPNLSLKPMPRPVFRFVCSPGLYYSTIIILKEDEMIIKKGVKGWEAPIEDESLLTETERRRYHLLKRRYPLNTAPYRPSLQRYIDSMLKDCPQLMDPAYYRYLINKSLSGKREPFIYTAKRIPLKPAEYLRMVTAINKSGYWKLPRKLPFLYQDMDGAGYTLEANTPGRYNLVQFSTATFDTPYVSFVNVCYEMYAYAGKQR